MATPAQILNIGTTSGTQKRNNFKLQYANDPPSSVVVEKTQAELAAGFDLAPYFTTVTTPYGFEAAQFDVRVDAATTSGTSNPRSELREMENDGVTERGFDSSVGTHWLWLRGRTTLLPTEKKTLVLAQLHSGSGGAGDLLVVTTQLSSGVLKMLCRVNGTSSGQPNLANPYVLGDPYEILLKGVNGVWDVYYNDLVTPVISGAAIVHSTTAYFKAGGYLNVNEADVADDTERGRCEVFWLQTWHTGDPDTYDPQTPTQSVPAIRPSIALSPARTTASNSTAVTSATFNPPAGLLVVCVSGTGGSQANPTVAITNNGAALTWTEIGRATRTTTGGTNSNDGMAAIFAAVLPAARTGMTVTATQSSGSSPTSIKPYSIADANVAGDYVGGSVIGRSTANKFNTTGFTAESDASLLFVVASEWEPLSPAPTSSDTTEESVVIGSSLGVLSGYRDITAKTTQTVDLDGGGTANGNWMYVVAEILPAPAPAPPAGSFLFAA